MKVIGLAEAARLAAQALDDGRVTVHGVVVGAPGRGDLVGQRVVWDGQQLHGDLGEATLTSAAEALLASGAESAMCVTIPGSDVELYVETLAPAPELVIVGAGHIAVPLSNLGALLGFRVTVLDDRPDFAKMERFPDADRVIIADFEDPFAGIAINHQTHIVMVTRGHRYDYDCMLVLAKCDVQPAYVGMIGSRRRVKATYEQLAGEGVDAEWLSRVHAPLGLDLGAETPAEIAVAVAAEIVLRTRGGTGRPLRDVTDVIKYVQALSDSVTGRS
ncbi:MAG: XdhC family protein [Gemmatimonadota bacterium]|jgi:xanthine dehydrogenase accessory factor